MKSSSWYTSVMMGDVPGIPVGFIVAGVLLLIFGINQAHENYNLYHLCNSTLGKLAQDFSGTVSSGCGSAERGEVIGVLMVVGGVVLAIVGWILVKKGMAENRARSMAVPYTPPGMGYTGPPPAPPGYGAPTYTAPSGPSYPATPTAAPATPAPPAPGPPVHASGPVDPGYRPPTAPSRPTYTPATPAPAPAAAEPPAAKPQLKGRLAKPSDSSGS